MVYTVGMVLSPSCVAAARVDPPMAYIHIYIHMLYIHMLCAAVGSDGADSVGALDGGLVTLSNPEMTLSLTSEDSSLSNCRKSGSSFSTVSSGPRIGAMSICGRGPTAARRARGGRGGHAAESEQVGPPPPGGEGHGQNTARRITSVRPPIPSRCMMHGVRFVRTSS